MRNANWKKFLPGAGDYPLRIHGVDFSGAKDAGKKIWIASGCIEDESLQITDCYRCDNLPGSGKNRDQCLTALAEFIASNNRAAFGLDFPFGLPKELVQERTWEEFVLAFTDHYESPEVFRGACRSAALGKEKRRLTDLESKTPFSPYNLRLFRQTYYGISSVSE